MKYAIIIIITIIEKKCRLDGNARKLFFYFINFIYSNLQQKKTIEPLVKINKNI